MKSKRQLTIYLADLTHTGIRIANEAFPLNVGLLASYALKRFGDDIRVKLFKYPEKLLQALEQERCDILACSNYVWNDQLSEWAFETAKSINPEVLTVRGGPNFPLEEREQEAYLRKRSCTDLYCLYEGELAFAQVIERVLAAPSRRWDETPIDGCVFLAKKGTGGLTKGAPLHRLEDLDEIPSPYTTGLLDEFFDGNLTPLLATTRGCPFTCNYCNSANPLYNKVTFFSPGYVIDEINYIAGKVAGLGISNLTFSDNNFGMYPRDKAISQALRETQRRYGWPRAIICSTGKNKVDQVVENTAMLGDALTISMSVQSMDQNTLKMIERDNIRPEMYHEIARAMEKKGRARVAELIVPLPEESYAGYLKGIGQLIEAGASSVVSYTLALSKGTVYTSEAFRQKYGYQGKLRLIPNDFGTYGGKMVFDYEEVVTCSNTLSFEEYLGIRKFALVTELLLNNSICSEMIKVLGESGFGITALMERVLEYLPDAPAGVRETFDLFVAETTSELKEDERALIDFYSDPDNYRKLAAGEVGGNIIYKHKGLMLVRHMDAWISYVRQCAISLIEARAQRDKDRDLAARLQAIGSFISAKLAGLFEQGRTDDEVVLELEYDVAAWLRSEEEKPLTCFKTSTSYRFYYDADQKKERRDLFSRYSSDVSGLSKIMARLMSLDRMFRKVAAGSTCENLC